jgi:hypothetical protein
MSSLAIVSFLSWAKVPGANRRPSDKATAETASAIRLLRFIRCVLSRHVVVRRRQLPPRPAFFAPAVA